MLLISIVKFIVFLLSLSDIRSLPQIKKVVNMFFVFFKMFFKKILFFLTNAFAGFTNPHFEKIRH